MFMLLLEYPKFPGHGKQLSWVFAPSQGSVLTDPVPICCFTQRECGCALHCHPPSTWGLPVCDARGGLVLSEAPSLMGNVQGGGEPTGNSSG